MSRYLDRAPAARIPQFPRSHAPTGDVQSLDPSDIAAAAAKQKLQQQRDRDEADGGSVTPDDEEESGMQECKYSDDELLKTRTPLLTGSDPADKREEIRDYFHRTFSLYERLFDVLVSDSTFAMQPEKLRHPLIFYFGRGTRTRRQAARANEAARSTHSICLVPLAQVTPRCSSSTSCDSLVC